MKYWIQRWSLLRKKELMFFPDEFFVNEVYNEICTGEELYSGFKELNGIFSCCYNDILNDPAGMLLSTYDMNEYGYFSEEARTSREESYKYAKILYILGYCGELTQDGNLRICPYKLKEQCKALKITKIGAFLNRLSDYGIKSAGLVNGRIKSDSDIVISYPVNINVIRALYIMAVKSYNTNRFNDFCRLNYKLFDGDWNTVEYGNGVESVSDILSSEQERLAAELIHDELMKRNYYYNYRDWNEGPQIRYYKKESDCIRNTNAVFWLASMDTELKLYFRIKHMDRVIEYVKKCPDSVINSFMVSDNGCGNRASGKCTFGISYQLDGSTIWRCGCCNPNFQVTPSTHDYLYYIDAVELSWNK